MAKCASERRPAVGLLVPCEVRRISQQIGYGLFAKESISQGTTLWKYTEETVKEYSCQEFQQLLLSLTSDTARVRLLRTAYGWRGKLVVPLDDSIYWNHSVASNCATGGGRSGNDTLAARDILSGEELLDNYLNYEYPPWLLDLHARYGVDKSYLCNDWG
jgi:hypothetical protein